MKRYVVFRVLLRNGTQPMVRTQLAYFDDAYGTGEAAARAFINLARQYEKSGSMGRADQRPADFLIEEQTQVFETTRYIES